MQTEQDVFRNIYIYIGVCVLLWWLNHSGVDRFGDPQKVGDARDMGHLQGSVDQVGNRTREKVCYGQHSQKESETQKVP